MGDCKDPQRFVSLPWTETIASARTSVGANKYHGFGTDRLRRSDSGSRPSQNVRVRFDQHTRPAVDVRLRGTGAHLGS